MTYICQRLALISKWDSSWICWIMFTSNGTVVEDNSWSPGKKNVTVLQRQTRTNNQQQQETVRTICVMLNALNFQTKNAYEINIHLRGPKVSKKKNRPTGSCCPLLYMLLPSLSDLLIPQARDCLAVEVRSAPAIGKAKNVTNTTRTSQMTGFLGNKNRRCLVQCCYHPEQNPSPAILWERVVPI